MIPAACRAARRQEVRVPPSRPPSSGGRPSIVPAGRGCSAVHFHPELFRGLGPRAYFYTTPPLRASERDFGSASLKGPKRSLERVTPREESSLISNALALSVRAVLLRKARGAPRDPCPAFPTDDGAEGKSSTGQIVAATLRKGMNDTPRCNDEETHRAFFPPSFALPRAFSKRSGHFFAGPGERRPDPSGGLRAPLRPPSFAGAIGRSSGRRNRRDPWTEAETTAASWLRRSVERRRRRQRVGRCISRRAKQPPSSPGRRAWTLAMEEGEEPRRTANRRSIPGALLNFGFDDRDRCPLKRQHSTATPPS